MGKFFNTYLMEAKKIPRGEGGIRKRPLEQMRREFNAKTENELKEQEELKAKEQENESTVCSPESTTEGVNAGHGTDPGEPNAAIPSNQEHGKGGVRRVGKSVIATARDNKRKRSPGRSR